MATALLFATAMYGQQDPNYTFYRYNMNIYNPAFAGSSDVAELSLGMRSQWAGVEGAPQSQSAIFDMPLGKNIGVGASILNDKTFIEQQTWVGIDVSYNIQLSEDHRLYFGIKGSANSYDANTQGLVTYGVGQDGALMDFKGRFTPNVGAGLYLKHYRYFVSLSAPKLFTPDRLQEEDGNAYLGTDRLHTYLSGGYTFILGGKIDLKTMGMLRYVNAAPLSTELTAILDFGQRFELGTSYRFNESVSGLFLLNISSGFRLGYAYEAATQSAISGMESGTHELFMKIQL
ncbi:PorP/SprF family type IX secretion system membrane protein [Maribacter ulvicola]|nr:type IX secretion system membrane protein PorP/SprF [Maribacter ulvicola]